jgi:hypothetical protein
MLARRFPRLDFFVYLSAIVLVFADAGYGTLWALGDISARLGLWPDTLIRFPMYSFIATMSLWQELPFFVGVICKLTSLALLLLRHRLTFWVQLVALVFAMIDWILLTGNNVYSGGLDATLQTAAQMSGVLLVGYLYTTGWFPPRRVTAHGD